MIREGKGEGGGKGERRKEGGEKGKGELEGDRIRG